MRVQRMQIPFLCLGESLAGKEDALIALMLFMNDVRRRLRRFYVQALLLDQ